MRFTKRFINGLISISTILEEPLLQFIQRLHKKYLIICTQNTQLKNQNHNHSVQIVICFLQTDTFQEHVQIVLMKMQEEINVILVKNYWIQLI